MPGNGEFLLVRSGDSGKKKKKDMPGEPSKETVPQVTRLRWNGGNKEALSGRPAGALDAILDVLVISIPILILFSISRPHSSCFFCLPHPYLHQTIVNLLLPNSLILTARRLHSESIILWLGISCSNSEERKREETNVDVCHL